VIATRPLLIATCLGGAMLLVALSRTGHPPSSVVSVPKLVLTQNERNRLATLKVFFAHQSVGANILQGVQELAAEDRALPVRLVRSASPDTVQGPAIVETPIGTNGNASSNASGFSAAMERGLGASGGVAMYKYCYLDITAATDVQRVFAEHRAVVERLRAAHPEVTIVHVTAPLTSSESPARALLKRLLGKPGVREANAKRNQLNALVRETYAGRDPLFDLATIESTRPDGTRSFVGSNGDTVYTLASEYTDDGGHLNQLGRRVAATKFLQLLAKL
jgi:lysophospholipase L1-like esterase